MAKSRSNKRKLSKNSDGNTSKKPLNKKPNKATAVTKQEISDGSSSEPESEPEEIQKLLEPYSKDQLIGFICDAAINDLSLTKRIREIADRDISQRKIFVRGLSWDTTRDILYSAFESFGEIEECNVVTDRVTGKAKGFGFVLFKTREGAVKALKQPQKKINNRFASWQLASTGGILGHHSQDATGRRINVGNVHTDADPEKLRAFFGKFGEIETGPLGFDFTTGKSRGFAVFVYKTHEGAKKALEEPYKMFEGHQLHCQMQIEKKNKPAVQPMPAVQPTAQGPVLAAVAAAQNLAIFGQHPSLNPAYSALLGNPNVAGLGGYSASHGLGSVGGSSSVLGAYGSSAPSLQDLQSYQNSHFGQSSASRAHAMGGSLSGFPAYF